MLTSCCCVEGPLPLIRSTGAVVVSVSFRLGIEYALKSASLIVVLLTFCCGLKLDDIVGVPGLMNVLS